MNTQKVAITIPNDIITILDKISKEEGISRSRYISLVLRNKIKEEYEKNFQVPTMMFFQMNQYKKSSLKHQNGLRDQAIMRVRHGNTEWINILDRFFTRERI